MNVSKRSVLLSAVNQNGLEDFARSLLAKGFELYAHPDCYHRWHDDETLPLEYVSAQDSDMFPVLNRTFDLVVVNLPTVNVSSPVEGLTHFRKRLLEMAMKKWEVMTPIVDPSDYSFVLDFLDQDGSLPLRSKKHFLNRAMKDYSEFVMSTCTAIEDMTSPRTRKPRLVAA